MQRSLAVQHPPMKSLSTALLFSVFLGPIGLLYASFWGGVLMITLGFVFVAAHFLFLASVVWVGSCIWAVRAIESAYRKGV